MSATSTPEARCVCLAQSENRLLKWLDFQVTGYAADQLDQALEGVEVVVIPAGVPRKVCAPVRHYDTYD